MPRGDNSHWANIHSKMLVVVSDIEESFAACLLLCNAYAKLLSLHEFYC